MKLSDQERKALAMIRQLHSRQREKLIGQLESQVIANRVSRRVGQLRKLKIPEDRKVEKAFGGVPRWKGKGGGR